MTSYGDARPSGRTPFEEELMTAMNRFANSTSAPEFDAHQIVRRSRRRRTAAIAAVAAGLILAGGGTALATTVAGGSTPATSTPAASSAAVKSDATVMLYRENPTIPIDFGGWSLAQAKTYLLKTQTKLGTVTNKAVEGCKPGSVIEVSPHAPAIVHKGDTVGFTICTG